MRFTFNTPDDELPLIMGLRPILQKAQWEGKDFAESGLDDIPISSAPYVITDFEPGRFVLLERNPDYWGADLPFRRGTNNLDQIRMEFFADGTAMSEAFKGGILNTMRETNVQKWDTQYDFPAVQAGDVVKSIIPHQRPTGIKGLVFNTRRAQFEDWRVREALITAFNFEFINTTINGEAQPRITSPFGNSVFAMAPGEATGKVRDFLEPHADHSAARRHRGLYAARRRRHRTQPCQHPQSALNHGRGRLDASGRDVEEHDRRGIHLRHSLALGRIRAATDRRSVYLGASAHRDQPNRHNHRQRRIHRAHQNV